MLETDVIVKNSAGIHTRPAAMIVKVASKFKSDIFLNNNGMKINAKSIVGVMTLTAVQGSKIKIILDGKDEQEAAKALVELFESGFNEI